MVHEPPFPDTQINARRHHADQQCVAPFGAASTATLDYPCVPIKIARVECRMPIKLAQFYFMSYQSCFITRGMMLQCTIGNIYSGIYYWNTSVH
jgi:hypothetical protein